MKSRANNEGRFQRMKSNQGEGPNWVLIVGGALLSTLSIRVGCKLKQAMDWKRDNATVKGSERTVERKNLGNCRSHSSLNSFGLEEHNCFNCTSGDRVVEIKNSPNGQILTESDSSLPLVTVPPPDYGMVWVSSPERGDHPPKPFHHHQSSTSDSPHASESGSDIFTKREVIQKLRQQLKRRDDMILDMQDQITELQNALNSQVSHSNHLQSQLDAANRDLFDSEREIQRLRKAIADHCLAHGDPNEKRNGHANGFLNGDTNFDVLDKSKTEMGRIEMLKKEIGDLKDVITGKDFLLQNYKEEKTELSTKIKELQDRLDSQLPHIL